MTDNLIEVKYSKTDLNYELSLLSEGVGVITVKRNNSFIGYINMTDIENVINQKKSFFD